MGTIWIRELTGGLDTRRLPETTPGGVLIKAENGHITRGGEFQKRPAFVRRYALPAGTIGLAQNGKKLVVFGTGGRPGGVPADVDYVSVPGATGQPIRRVLDFDVFSSKLYVVVQYTDNTINHFYGGVRVEDWFDGRARAAINVTGGRQEASTQATSTFRVTAGVEGALFQVFVGGVPIMQPVGWNSDPSGTATAIAQAIQSQGNYQASRLGSLVTVRAPEGSAAYNGRQVALRLEGGAAVGEVQGIMAGGKDAVQSRIDAIYVNGSQISNTVAWRNNNIETAAAIAANINSVPSNPEYTAKSKGAQVIIIAGVSGLTANGSALSFSLADGFTLAEIGQTVTFSDGANVDATYQPGTTARTIGSKMFSVSGTNLHFSGILQPASWTTETVGAGFIDMSTQASGTETLSAVETYQNYIAIFGTGSTLIWYMDPDPTLNRSIQTLNNTGTRYPSSVTPFGDTDILYLDESGLRSLQARDSSNAASTSDIGVPIDADVLAQVATLTEDERLKIFGLVNPQDGRFWLVLRDQIYVFSFYANAKVSAWSRYTPTITGPLYNAGLFEVDEAVVFQRKVYIRSGNDILVYGGAGLTPEYDYTQAVAWLPFFDAEKPGEKKRWQGIDAAIKGDWEVLAGMDVTNQDAVDPVARISNTTFESDRISMTGHSTHLGLRFISYGNTENILSSIMIHFESAKDES